MLEALHQLEEIGISEYFDPVIRKGYPFEFDMLYITTDKEKPLVVHVIDKFNVDIELEFDEKNHNWYDSGMFDLYIPDSPLYQLGEIYDIKHGVDACEITLNDGPAFAYYIYNKQTLVVGNWLDEEDYIKVIVKLAWPKIKEKLFLSDKPMLKNR